MLRRRWLINLALFGVVLVLALLAQLEQERADQNTRLTALAAQDIQRLALLRPGQPSVRLERRDDGWQMLEPFATAANAAPIDRLLPITKARVQRTLPAAALDLAGVGLEPALVRLQLDDLELRFGRTEPIAAQRYVQIGDMVHLIDDRHLPQLLATAEDYVSKRLLPEGFSPGLARIDGRPLSAGAVAGLAEVAAEHVEPLTGQLSGRVLTLESADGGQGVRFLIADGGTRWSRLDQRLSYVFTSPPLAEVDEDRGLEALAPSDNDDDFHTATDRELLRLQPPAPGREPTPEPEPIELLPASPRTDTPLPTQKLTP